MDYQCYATCPDELTGLLAEEITTLGGTDVRTAYRVVYFKAPPETAYKVNLHSRLASRVFRVLKIIPAHSPTIIFDKAKKIRFDEVFSAGQPVSISVVASSEEKSIPTHLIGSKLREAINDCFLHHQDILPNQSSWDPVIGISGYFHQKKLMVSVDMSGESLHRRGFRVEGHPAPLKETLAAALLAFCRYDGSVPFYDPMCGSGTLAVEAAMIAINRAPLIQRKKGSFGFEHFRDFDPQLWRTVVDQAREAEHPAKAGLFASDIEAQFVGIAQKSLAKARLETLVRLERKDFFETEKPAESGLLVANIPYGFRMDGKEGNADFWRALGDHLKYHFKGWNCGILAPASAPLKELRLKPRKQASFRNGTLPVRFVLCEMY